MLIKMKFTFIRIFESIFVVAIVFHILLLPAKCKADTSTLSSIVSKKEARQIHEANLRKLSKVVLEGDVVKIKSQVRVTIDSAVTAQDKKNLKIIVDDIIFLIKHEARMNQQVMSDAIQEGQESQERIAKQRRLISKTILRLLGY